MITLAQIGCGYWGPNLLRNFSAQPGCRVKWVADINPERCTFVQQNYSNIKISLDWKEVVMDPDVEALVVATPVSTHYRLAKAGLEADKHVFVEKPLALSLREADELVALARTKGRTLMVGDTFLYNEAVRTLKRFLDQGELGQVYYIHIERLNLGQARSDVNAWWSLAPHDVSILLYLMGGKLPDSIMSYGMDYLQPGMEDVVFASLTWPGRVTAQIHVSWLDPRKVRRMTFIGSRKMIVYDDVSDDKIAVLDKGIDRVPRIGERMDYDSADNYQLFLRAGDAWLPKIDFREPLKIETAHFLECIQTGQEPLSGSQHALKVVTVLEAGDRSLKSGGRKVSVP